MAPRLALADAQQVLDAALAKAEEIGQPMNVAVVDDGGHLLAFSRQDGAILASVDIAIRKARTAALLKMTTAQAGEAAAPGAPLYGIEVTNGGLVIFGGGIPLVRGRDVVGAVGVSAGSVEQDTTVAEAGVQALPKRAARR
ncbi:GlcG/HbpS family heme-binding protein [Prauserella cavernicola]|uniref:Heme-binding protein n=1 Tax=Prauserella cavernicola TaxID=2800127 RepID=A0A934QQ16_9PSEU|nr:heme-binding protein [Prauserella cavernicola]MBK1783314.1 heme-binding protein [Prauserella cavernicola]